MKFYIASASSGILFGESPNLNIMYNLPNATITERIENAKVMAKVGDKVVFTNNDGAQLVGEIVELSTRWKNWVTKVKVVGKDGKVTVKDVSELIVEVVVLAADTINSNVFQKIAQFFKNLFKKKNK